MYQMPEGRGKVTQQKNLFNWPQRINDWEVLSSNNGKWYIMYLTKRHQGEHVLPEKLGSFAKDLVVDGKMVLVQILCLF